MQKITTFISFPSGGKEAVEFYVSVFKNSKIDHAMTMPGSDQLLHAAFSLDGQEYMAMDVGGHEGFELTDGISLFVGCADQTEVDYYWEALQRDGGHESQCGWLKDRFGVSWQVIPMRLGELMSDPNQTKAGAVMQAMLKMKKIVVADLEKAYDGA